jgi:signal transduction histidine kinase
MGGPGVWMGIGVIMSAGLIGIFWAHDSLKRKRKNRAVHFLLLGLIVHVTMLGCTVLLPDNQFIPTLRMIVLPVLLIYIPGTMMLGMLLEAQRQNAQNRKEKQRLYEMEHKLSSDLLEKQQELHDLIEKYKLLTIDYQQQNVELKISKEKAEEGERLKSAFLDNISHEIRTPMNAIMGFTDLLDVDGLSREKRVQYVEIIRQSGKYLLSVINDIVEISHIETGLVEINRSEIDPDVMLQEIFSTCNVLFPKSKDIKFKIETATGFVPGKLVCDAVKLRQVLINLVNNALKFTDQGEICLGYYFHDVDRISFFVRDTGIGIAEENQKIIFERFRQVGAGRSNSRGGSG